VGVGGRRTMEPTLASPFLGSSNASARDLCRDVSMSLTIPNRQCAQGRKGEGEREGGCVGFSNGTLHVAISLHCQVPSAVSVRKTMV